MSIVTVVYKSADIFKTSILTTRASHQEQCINKTVETKIILGKGKILLSNFENFC